MSLLKLTRIGCKAVQAHFKFMAADLVCFELLKKSDRKLTLEARVKRASHGMQT